MNPDSAEKMRNHLAEEVLDSNMLHLMKEYQKSLGVAKTRNGIRNGTENGKKLRNYITGLEVIS